MDSETNQQIINLINKSKRILLLTHSKADCDGLGSMISMYLTLQKLGKDVIAATNDPAPENLSFLPSMSIVQNSLVAARDFVITLDITRTPLNKIRYNLEDGHVNIVISPKAGRFSPDDISFDHQPGGAEEKFDLIITFDTGNLEHLGPIYDKNSEMFFKTPLINIDHHASNTDYGQVNLVDVVSASTTSVLFHLLKDMEGQYKDTFVTEDIATLLLAGLITDTGNFQHANTSPDSMEIAAELLDMGARQQEIIKNIYKTKKLSTLKLWGVVLSKVESDPIYRIVWSSISKEDLAETGAKSEEAEGIIDDLLASAPGAEAIMLVRYNEEGYISTSMRSTTNSVDVGKICQELGGGGHIRAAGFKMRDGKSLDEVIQTALGKVREYQGKRLNIHPDTIHQPQQAPQEQPIEEQAPQEPPKNIQYLDFAAPKPKEQPAPAPKQEAPKQQPAPKQTQKPQPKPQPKVQQKPQQPKQQPAAPMPKPEPATKPEPDAAEPPAAADLGEQIKSMDGPIPMPEQNQ